MGTSADVSLKIAETDLSSLTASIRAPSGNEEPCLLKKLPNRHLGRSAAGARSLWGADRPPSSPLLLLSQGSLLLPRRWASMK